MQEHMQPNNFKDQAELIKVLKVLRIPWTWVTRILEKFNGLLFLEDIQTIYFETHYSNILKYLVKLPPLVQESMYKFSISRLIILGCTSFIYSIFLIYFLFYFLYVSLISSILLLRRLYIFDMHLFFEWIVLSVLILI